MSSSWSGQIAIAEMGPQDVRVGMAVEVVFEDISPAISLPKFRPSEAS